MQTDVILSKLDSGSFWLQASPNNTSPPRKNNAHIHVNLVLSPVTVTPEPNDTTVFTVLLYL